MQQDIANVLFAQELKQNAEHGFKTGAFAGWFIKGVMAAESVDIGQAMAMYAGYIEAATAGNHCHGDDDETVEAS